MDALFFLRSYGDFIVGLNALNNARRSAPLSIHASSHLQPLFGPLPEELKPALNIQFVDLGIRNAILGCFTNRFFFSMAAIKELIALRKYTRTVSNDSAVSTWYLEQSRRISFPALFTQINFQSIHQQGNIYRSYNRFFKHPVLDSCNPGFNFERESVIIVFPDSRKAEKRLPSALVDKINTFCENRCIVKIADFAAAKPGKRKEMSSEDSKDISSSEEISTNNLVYQNFAELIKLIQSADLVISADSLPVHLAQLLNKPHWIFYNQRTNTEWITPYAEQHDSYSCFHEFEKLALFLNRHSA